MAEFLFWPALLFYGEAAVGYLGDARRAGLAGRAATWGVRLGWLAQTALLIVQAAREDGFPWGTWAGLAQPLRLARRRRLSDLGLPQAVPAARPRGHAARRRAAHRLARGRRHRRRARAATTRTSSSSCTSASCSPRSPGSRSPPRSPRSTSGRSGGSSSARRRSCAGRRRRSRRSTGSPAAPSPSRVPALTLGIAVGIVRLLERRRPHRRARRRDARHLGRVGRVSGAARDARLSGRRAAYVALVGFALVIVVRLALPAAHFS